MDERQLAADMAALGKARLAQWLITNLIKNEYDAGIMDEFGAFASSPAAASSSQAPTVNLPPPADGKVSLIHSSVIPI